MLGVRVSHRAWCRGLPHTMLDVGVSHHACCRGLPHALLGVGVSHPAWCRGLTPCLVSGLTPCLVSGSVSHHAWCRGLSHTMLGVGVCLTPCLVSGSHTMLGVGVCLTPCLVSGSVSHRAWCPGLTPYLMSGLTPCMLGVRARGVVSVTGSFPFRSYSTSPPPFCSCCGLYSAFFFPFLKKRIGVKGGGGGAGGTKCELIESRLTHPSTNLHLSTCLSELMRHLLTSQRITKPPKQTADSQSARQPVSQTSSQRTKSVMSMWSLADDPDEENDG